MPFDPEFWTRSLNEIGVIFVTWLPRLIGALVWLILGWMIARIAQFILGSLLNRMGLDKLSDRAGIASLLAKAGFTAATSSLIARLVYWLVLLVFILAATESLGLSQVVNTLEGLVAFLPDVLAAILILLFGSLLARLIGDGLGTLAVQAGVTAGAILGQAIRYILLVFVVILALEQLGVQTTMLITVTMALIGATALALALAFGIGSRELAHNIMAGFHAKEAFRAGQQVKVRGYVGRLVEVGPVKAVIETEDGLVSLPNFVLTDEEVIVIAEAGES
jgi:hypothetical protein